MRRIIITGASDGLGLRLARLAVSRGMDAVSLSRTPPPDPAIAHIPTDLADDASIASAVARIGTEYPEFDALVNCAGIMSVQKIGEIDAASAEKVLKVNALGPIMLCSRLADLIRANGADIVNVGSTVGHKWYASQAAYGASKWAIRGLTENLRLEFADSPTRVMEFDPGGFRSRIAEKATGKTADLSAYMDPEPIAELLLSLLLLPKNVEVSEIVINRKKAR